MLMIETADIVFSLDSIPAVISVSRDTFIIYSSNIFALLGLRALYFVMASAMQQLRYLKLTLVIILCFVGTKMMLTDIYHIETSISLLVIMSLLLVGILLSIAHKDRGPILATSPLARGIGRIYDITYAGIRRVFVLLLGISVVIMGIIMIVTPGPAIVVIPAGLAILATEFLWAKRMLKQFKVKFAYYSNETKAFFRRNKNK